MAPGPQGFITNPGLLVLSCVESTAGQGTQVSVQEPELFSGREDSQLPEQGHLTHHASRPIM